MHADAIQSRVAFWQLAFWPPDQAIIVSPKRRFAPRLIARLQILELTVLTYDRSMAEADRPSANYPCTWPGCPRGAQHPFETSGQLGNHRLAQHGIRSTNEESIRRQERRDKQRSKTLGAAPEYIDRNRIRELVGVTHPVTTSGIGAGPLNPGEREYVRKRLANFVTVALPREVRRAPAEICIAVAELAADGLTPAYVKITDDQKADITMERLTQLYTKSAIAS